MCGLSQLLDLYIEKQEEILTKTIGVKNNDEIYRIYHAEHLINLLNQNYNEIRREGLLWKLERAISDLDVVIEGGHLSESAKNLKERGIRQIRHERKNSSLQES